MLNNFNKSKHNKSKSKKSIALPITCTILLLGALLINTFDKNYTYKIDNLKNKIQTQTTNISNIKLENKSLEDSIENLNLLIKELENSLN